MCCCCVVSILLQRHAPTLFVSLSEQSHFTHTNTSLSCITISDTDSFSLQWWKCWLFCYVFKYFFFQQELIGLTTFPPLVFRKWTGVVVWTIVYTPVTFELLFSSCCCSCSYTHLCAHIWLALATKISQTVIYLLLIYCNSLSCSGKCFICSILLPPERLPLSICHSTSDWQFCKHMYTYICSLYSHLIGLWLSLTSNCY